MRESLTICSPWIPLLRLAVRKSHHHHRTTATTATAPLTGTSQPTTQPMVFPIPSHFAGTKCLQNFRKKKKIKFVPRKNVLPLGLSLIFFFFFGGGFFHLGHYVHYNIENWVWNLARTRTHVALFCMLSCLVSSLVNFVLLG